MLSRPKILGLSAVLASQLCVSGIASAQDAQGNPTNTPPATNSTGAAAPTGDAPGVAGGPSTPEEAVAPPKKSAEETIVVTGSRIRRKDLTSAAPVTVVSKEQVQASGKVSIGDFLQELPEQGNALNTSVNNGGDGSTRINLRGLGSNRTLILVDGKRMVAGGTGADSTPDLNSIPTAAIERIEILKDGASSVYGSDAIAGVVNIITRKKMNGAEVSGYAGTTTSGGGSTYDINAAAGTSGEKGNLLFNIGYYNQNDIFAGNRGWAKQALGYDYTATDPTMREYPLGSTAIPQGRVTINPATCATAAGAGNTPAQQKVCNDLLAKFGAKKKAFIYDPTSPTAVDGFRPYLPTSDSYNYQAVNYLVTPQSRISLFTSGDTKLADFARGYFQASYVNRQSSQLLAAEPLFAAPFAGVQVAAQNYYNPFGVDIPDARRRVLELSGRHIAEDIDTYRAVAGVDGTLPDSFGPAKGWFYDASFNYGRTSAVTDTNGYLRSPKIQDALGPSFVDAAGKPQCGADAAHQIAGCVPLDLFHGAGSITPDQLASLGYDAIDRGYDQMASAEFNLSGDLFSLAADRPVALALGYQYRRELGASIPNAIAQAGESSDSNGTLTAGSFNLNEVYGELSIPIISGMPGIDQLEASAALRYSNYSTFGGNTTYKLGARYRPIPDVTIRGTYSTGFRAPGIPELFSGVFDSYEAVSDPCGKTTDPVVIKNCGTAANNGDDNTQEKARVGGNTKLQPETAKILTAGIVLTPSALKGLSLTADYYNISVDGSISTIGAGTILAGCYPSSGGKVNNRFCGFIHRDPNSQTITSIDDTLFNVGGDATSGLDVAVRYSLPSEVGRFGFVVDGTYLFKFDRTLADGTVIQARNTYDLGVYPSIKFNAGITYAIGGFGAGITGRYIGNYQECGDTGGASGGSGLCYALDPKDPAQQSYKRDVGAYSVFDVFASYTLATSFGKTTLATGMTNMLNTDPRRVYDNTFTFSDPSAYDYQGRFVYGRISHAF
jgi:iron complex outermembrane receptor protein